MFHWQAGRYQALTLSEEEKVWLPEIQLGIGLWPSDYQGLEQQWLRWYLDIHANGTTGTGTPGGAVKSTGKQTDSLFKGSKGLTWRGTTSARLIFSFEAYF